MATPQRHLGILDPDVALVRFEGFFLDPDNNVLSRAIQIGSYDLGIILVRFRIFFFDPAVVLAPV